MSEAGTHYSGEHTVHSEQRCDLSLHSHLHFDCGMWVVVVDLKVLHAEIIDFLHFSQDPQFGEWSDLSLKLHMKHKQTCKFEIKKKKKSNETCKKHI